VLYYYAHGDEHAGPFQKPELAGRGLGPETLVWREGLAGWQPAGTLPELSDVLAGPAPYAPPTAAGLPPAGVAAPLLTYGGYAPPTGPLPQGLAVTSLVLGAASIPMLWFYCVGLPVGVLAIVFGHVARAQVRRNTGGGAGLALAGLICGYASLALTAAGVAFIFVAFSSFKMD